MYFSLIILLILSAAMQTAISQPTGSLANSPKRRRKIEQLVEFVLHNTRYYYDYRAPILETEIENNIKYIQETIDNSDYNSIQSQVYLRIKSRMETFLRSIGTLKGTCGIKGLLLSLAPTYVNDIQNTGDFELVARLNKISNLIAIDEDFDAKHLEQVRDRLNKFINGNKELQQEYEMRLSEVVQEKCGIVICL